MEVVYPLILYVPCPLLLLIECECCDNLSETPNLLASETIGGTPVTDGPGFPLTPTDNDGTPVELCAVFSSLVDITRVELVTSVALTLTWNVETTRLNPDTGSYESNSAAGPTSVSYLNDYPVLLSGPVP